MNSKDLFKVLGFILLIGLVVLLALLVEAKWVTITFALVAIPCGWWFLLRNKKAPGHQEIKNSSISCCHYIYDDLEYGTDEKKHGQGKK